MNNKTTTNTLRYNDQGNVHMDFHGATNTTIDFIIKKYGIETMNDIFKKVGNDVYANIKEHINAGNKTFSNYLTKHHLEIAPHGKTTMAPQIYADQIKYGAWGITAGAINQIQVMFDYGINKVLLANQIVSPKPTLYPEGINPNPIEYGATTGTNLHLSNAVHG